MKTDVYIEHDILLGNNKRIMILNTWIDVLTVKQTVELVDKYIATKTPLHLIGVNADKFNLLSNNERLRKIVNSCGIINADGVSVVLASTYLNKPLPERVAGIDLMFELLSLAENKGYSVYLLGAKEDVVQKTSDVLKHRFPRLSLSGVHNGFFSEDEWKLISEELKVLKPDLVFVGITSPKKEYLIDFLQKDGNTSVFMGVGGSFDVISGNVARAPLWLQKMNLEWFFRMLQEPRRLLKRYLVGNLLFIYSVFREKHG